MASYKYLVALDDRSQLPFCESEVRALSDDEAKAERRRLAPAVSVPRENPPEFRMDLETWGKNDSWRCNLCGETGAGPGPVAHVCGPLASSLPPETREATLESLGRSLWESDLLDIAGWLEARSLAARDMSKSLRYEQRAAAIRYALEDFAALRTECLRLREDAARLDWLDEESWWELSRTDASDNDGVGLVNSAVQMRSVGPDRPEFPALCAESVRVAIDSARAARSSRPENPTNG
jgi:hypothetical protein